MAATVARRRVEIIVTAALALLLVIAFFAWSSNVESGAATTVGNEQIAPTCDSPDVLSDQQSAGGGDGNGEVNTPPEPQPAAAGSGYCEP
jgi:hypothetical protein